MTEIPFDTSEALTRAARGAQLSVRVPDARRRLYGARRWP